MFSLLSIISIFLVHCALDIIDEKRGKKVTTTTAPISTDMYLGQLYAVEDYRVYECLCTCPVLIHLFIDLVIVQIQ